MFGVPEDANYKKELPGNIMHSYFGNEWKGNEGMYYITKKTYKSKTFTDYAHPFAEIIGAICNVGLNITGFQEFDYDISGMFEKLSHTGIPLS